MDTANYILEKVAPVFNKQGYVGTSLAAITKATGLTKGAIYCNFENKEDLALKAFELNIRTAIIPLFRIVAKTNGSIAKLQAITRYQRSYYALVKDLGGCPMLRAGVDTKFNNPLLFHAAEAFSKQMQDGLVQIFKDGVAKQEIKPGTDAVAYAQTMFALIEGSSLLAFTHNNESYISNAMDFIDEQIISKIKQ